MTGPRAENSDSGLEVRRATAADCHAMAALAAESRYQHASDGEHGFLLEAVDADGYRALVACSEAAFIASERDGWPVGFLVVLDFDRSQEGAAMGRGRTGAVIVGQVAVSRAHRRLGVGRLLYQAAFDTFGDRGFVATVSVGPDRFNAASVAFHSALGFSGATNLMVGDRLMRLFLRPSQNHLDALARATGIETYA